MLSDGDETIEVTHEILSVVAIRLMKLKKSTLVEMLAQYGVLLHARATKPEITDALAEQLLYQTDSDESDQSEAEEEEAEVVGESSWAERDAVLRENAIAIE